MTPRSARLLAVPLALLTFAASLAVTSWVVPLSFRTDSENLSLLMSLGPQMATLLIPSAVFHLATRAVRRRPAAWEVDDRPPRFRAGASAYGVGLTAIAVAWVDGFGLPTGREPAETGLRISTSFPSAWLTFVAWFNLVLAAVALVLVVAVLLGRRPHLTLNPAGLIRQGLLRRTTLPWTGLTAGHPPPPPNADISHLAVQQRTSSRAGLRKIRIAGLHLDPAFLAYTIRHYTAHPQHRADIGTTAELHRLKLAFQTDPWS